MIVGIMQPTFLPWQGLFELIYKSEIFIFLDDAQFSYQSWHQRNRLFTGKDQVDWYTVPVRKKLSFLRPLNETVIDERAMWREKTWKRLVQNYSKAPYFADFAGPLHAWLLAPYRSLAEQNMVFIRYVSHLLNLERCFRLSSSYPSDKHRSERVLELLTICGATQYLSAKGAFEYMLEDAIFPVRNVEVLFQDFIPRQHNQIGARARFFPYLSVLDALFNVGPDETSKLVRFGTERWLGWDEMLASRRKTACLFKGD